MNTTKNNITEKREDISRFVVHLTRDDRKTFLDQGATAVENLWTILNEKRIGAFRPHCLHSNRLKELPESIISQFNVSCFTETPLNQLHLLTQKIDGVRYQREPCGLVFEKKLLIEEGAQSAIYVNSYSNSSNARQAVDVIFDHAVSDECKSDAWKILPYVNAMHERYDFTWEREWRITGPLNFSMRDVVAIILPEVGEDKVRNFASEAGIAVISPGWVYEQIVAELSMQQRKTRRSWYAALKKAKADLDTLSSAGKQAEAAKTDDKT